MNHSYFALNWRLLKIDGSFEKQSSPSICYLTQTMEVLLCWVCHQLNRMLTPRTFAEDASEEKLAYLSWKSLLPAKNFSCSFSDLQMLSSLLRILTSGGPKDIPIYWFYVYWSYLTSHGFEALFLSCFHQARSEYSNYWTSPFRYSESWEV